MSQSIYITSCLETDQDNNGYTYGKSVFDALNNNFKDRIIPIQKTKSNVWCRDFMPIKSSTGKLVQFTYAPSYMTDTEKWRKRIPVANKIHDELNLKIADDRKSKIKLDGGAIDIHGKKGIVSDRVFRDNWSLAEQDVLDEIQSKLELDQLIVIPEHPYDFTGHVDGLVRFIDEDTVLINDLSGELNQVAHDEKDKKNYYRNKLVRNWYYSFKMALYNSGLKHEELPCTVAKNDNDKDGNGIYLNFLLLDDLIIMPTYRDKENDKKAKQLLMQYYEIRNVIGIDATDLAKEGGMINCVTWTK